MTKDTRPLLKSFLASFAIIATLKLVYFLVSGVKVDSDSPLYLTCVFHFDYPWLYPYFLYVARLIHDSLEFIVILQCLGFALAASILLVNVVLNKRHLLFASLFIGIEPVSGYFQTSILSEALFLPLLLFLLGTLLIKRNWLYQAVIAGLVASLLYQTRFAGQLFFLLFPLFLMMQKQLRLGALFTFCIVALLALLPIKIRYYQLFGTTQLNAVSGESLWNNASVLIPSQRNTLQAANNFERYVLTFPDSIYSTEMAAHATHVDSLGAPYHLYRKNALSDFKDLPEDANVAAGLAKKLIIADPIGYLSKFVWPNFKRIFLEDDFSIQDNELNTLLKGKAKLTYWNHYGTWVSLLLLLFSTALCWRQRPDPFFITMILISWMYVLCLPFVSPMVVRYYYLLIPVLLFSSTCFLIKKRALKPGLFHNRI